MKDLVIFDLDGTLLNTIDDLAMASNYALRQCGYPIHAVEAYPMFVGNGVTRLLERVLPEDERTEENVRRMREQFMIYYDEHCTDFTRPYDGIPEMLSSLTSKGIAVAVASNKYQSAVSRLIRHYFGSTPWVAIEGQKEGVPVKPDPSIVFEILLKHPTPKAAVLYAGDSGVDMTTASRAAVENVGVTWGFRPVRELRAAYADHIAQTPDEVLRLATELPQVQ